MRFDFVPFFNPGENIPWNRVVKMMREQTQLAEQADFTTVWLTEQHDAFLDYHNEPDVDHFGVVERLVNIDSDIFQKVKSWLL